METWAYCDSCGRWFYCPSGTVEELAAVTCPVCCAPAGRFEQRAKTEHQAISVE